MLGLTVGPGAPRCLWIWSKSDRFGNVLCSENSESIIESLKKLLELEILFQSPVNHDICRSQGNRENESERAAAISTDLRSQNRAEESIRNGMNVD